MFKLSAETTQSLVKVIWVGIIASLAGCGGGGGGGGSDEKGQPAAENPYVITNDAASVTTQGQFKSVDGYLSRSKKVLVSASGKASAKFTLGIDKKGYYKTFIWASQFSPPAQVAADVTIRHSAGETLVVLYQFKRLGQWELLGLYEFDPTGRNEIEIASRNGGALAVDAVRFEYFGSESPPLQFEVTGTPGGENSAPILTDAEINQPYSENLVVIGGTLPYRFSIEAGALPSGLSLDERLGRISGTPTALSHNPVTLAVTDAAGARIAAQIDMMVVAPPAEIIAPPVTSESKAKPLDGNTVGTPPDLSGLVSILKGIPEGSWVKVNLNLYSDAWTPEPLRPLVGAGNPTPHKIILAWSSFAWDPNRGDLWLYGGGHGNYSGNDVYRWRGTTRLWGRASLPSEVNQDDRGTWKAIDGQDAAPASAHTYDNNMFLPILDRMLVLGGAAYNNGGHYMKQTSPTTSRRVGPYLFDPNRADSNKVGGTTGSHVKRVAPYPDVLGGNMWQNRDIYVNVPGIADGTTATSFSHVSGCTGYAVENGKDVVYLAAMNGSTQHSLYRYVINNVNDPTQDGFTKVGRYWISSPGAQPACAYDPVQKVFFRKLGSNTFPFDYWDLNTAGPFNSQIKPTVTDPTGEFDTLLATNNITASLCGMDFDPVRRKYALWCRDGRVWMITPPATLGPTGWIIQKQITPTGATPLDTDSAGGVIGKWKYIANLDAFMALHHVNEGQVWLYKPIGWTLSGGPPTAKTVVVDNASQGVQDSAGGRTFTGTWCTSAGLFPVGADSLYSCGEGGNTYRWTPNIAVAGAYDVYVRWTVFPNRSATVPIAVKSASGTLTQTFNEKTGGDVWALHGRYNFAAGTGGYAEVSDSNGQANADAVQSVPVAP